MSVFNLASLIFLFQYSVFSPTVEAIIIIFILQYKAIKEKYRFNISKADQKKMRELQFHYTALESLEDLYPVKQAHEYRRFERITTRSRY